MKQFRIGDVIETVSGAQGRVLEVAPDFVAVAWDNGNKNCHARALVERDRIVRRPVKAGDVLYHPTYGASVAVSEPTGESIRVRPHGEQRTWSARISFFTHLDGTKIDPPAPERETLPAPEESTGGFPAVWEAYRRAADAAMSKAILGASDLNPPLRPSIDSLAFAFFSTDPEVLEIIAARSDAVCVKARGTETTLQYEGQPRVVTWRAETFDRKKWKASIRRAWERDEKGRRSWWVAKVGEAYAVLDAGVVT